MPVPDDSVDILRAIRRIVRAVDLHSRRLRRESGLNVPQLLTLEAIGHPSEGPVLAAWLAEQVGVSAGTMSGIVDHLVRQGLVDRSRADDDRRCVHLALTEAGRRRLALSPRPLQSRLLERLLALSPAERAEILGALDRLGTLMEAQDLDAAPVLAPQPGLDPRTSEG